MKIFTRLNVLIVLLSSAITASAQNYNTTLPQQCSPTTGGTEVLTFPLTPPAASSGTLTLTYTGDLDLTTEHLLFYDESMTLLGQSPAVPGQCTGIGTSVFTLPQAALAAWAASGNNVVITVQASSSVNVNAGAGCTGYSFCVTGQLQYSVITGPDDAGVLSLDSPMNFCTGAQNFLATIANFGTNNIDCVQVHWSINGTAQSPVMYNGGTLFPFGSGTPNTAQVLLGSSTLASPSVIKVWTAFPNNVPDTINGNDTIIDTRGPSMSGTYSIGGIGGDFPNFAGAVNALINLGVCGPVTFNVATGVYNEKVSIPPITGASSTNTITFQSASGNNTSVTLTSAGTGTTDNYTVYFYGADYIRFKDMTIENTSSTYGTALYYGSDATYNIVSGCIITCPASTSTSTNMALIYSESGSLDDHCWFIDNDISGGSYSFYWYGISTTVRGKGFRVEGNTITPGYYRTIYSYYQDSVIIHDNVIMATTGITATYYWLYLYYNKGTFQITNNHIAGYSTGTNYGIYLSSSGGNVQTRALIANNFFSWGTSSSTNTFYGIYTTSAGLIDIVHNNINMTSSSATTRGIYLASGGNIRVYNNNVKVNGPGTAIYSANVFVLQDSDFNNFYAPTGNVGYAGVATPTLNDWIMETEMDLNSFSVDPNYVSETDLHVCNDTLDGNGINLDIAEDFDGDIRNPSRIDIGADQFIAGAPELGPDTFYCTGSQVIIGSPAVSNVTYMWNTTATTSTIAVTSPGSYILTTLTACGTGSDTVVVSEKTVPVVDFSMLQNYLTGIFTNNTPDGDSFLWDFGDGNTSADENPVHVFTTSGYHTVTLTVTNACGTSSITKNINIQIPGVAAVDEGILNVYPNPVQDHVRIDLSGAVPGSYLLTVADIQGRIVAERKEMVSGNRLTVQMDLSALPSGLYFIRLSGESHNSAVRIVKH